MQHAVTPACYTALVWNTSDRIGPGHAAPRRVASRRIVGQTPRVASRCVLACVSCTYYHRRNARERTISIIIINPPAQRDCKMHLARGRTGNGRMHEDNTLRVVIKGRGRKSHIYRDHHLPSILQYCIANGFVRNPCREQDDSLARMRGLAVRCRHAVKLRRF